MEGVSAPRFAARVPVVATFPESISDSDGGLRNTVPERKRADFSLISAH